MSVPQKCPTTLAELETMESAGWRFADIQTFGGNHFLLVPGSFERLRLTERMQRIEAIDLHDVDLKALWDGTGVIGGAYENHPLTDGKYSRVLAQFVRGPGGYSCWLLRTDGTAIVEISGEIGIYFSSAPTAGVMAEQMRQLDESDLPILSPSAGDF